LQSLVLAALVMLPGAAAQTRLKQGALSIAFADDFSFTMTITGQGDAVALPPAVFVGGKMRQLGDTDFECKLANGGATTSGSDSFGKYNALALNCTVKDKTATLVDYSIKIYSVPGYPVDTMVLFDVSFPGGASGLQMRAVQVEHRSPPQFAPFPAFDLGQSASPVLGKAALAMCFGSERPHLLAFNGVSGFPGQCTTLSGGMAVTAWATKTSPSGVAGAVWTAANQFHLNFHQVVAAGAGASAQPEPGGGAATSKVWVHGVSGEISSVPAGWEQRTMMYYSGQGINPAVDGWGTTLRQVHKTTKNDAEDLFLQTVSYWTDNGAAANGVAWKTSAAPPKASHGQYLQLNYTSVDEAHLGAMIDSIASSGGVRPRAAQIDCWWYPTSKQHQFYCGTDWVLPREFYPNGMAGLRERLATPGEWAPSAAVESRSIHLLTLSEPNCQ
jgi:hypothetical protein